MDNSEAKYFTIFNEASDGILVVNNQGEVTEVNNSFCKLLGYSREEFLQMTIEELIDPEELKVDPIAYARVIAGEQIIRERRYRRKDGVIIEVQVNNKKSSDNQLIIVCRDLTEIRKAQREKELSEAQFESSFKSSAMGMVIISPEGKFLRVNETMVEMLGYSEDELIDKTFNEITYHEDQQIGSDFLNDALAGRSKSRSFEKRYIHKDGHLVWVNVTTSLVSESSGVAQYFVAQIQDITNRVESETKYTTLLNKALLGIYIQVDDRFQFVNPRLCEILGYTADELNNLPLTSIIYEEDIELALSWKQKRIIEQRDEIQYELRLVRKNGEVIWVEVRSSTILLAGGSAVMGNVIDITRRKKNERELKRINHDVSERVKELNGLYKFTQVANDESKSIEEAIEELVNTIPPSYQYPKITTARITLNNKVFESRAFETSPWCQKQTIKTEKGEIGLIEVYYIEEKPLLDEGPFLKEERSLLNSMADILATAIERKNVNALLKEQAETFQAIIENAKESVYLLAPDYTIQQFNKTAGDRMLGRGIELKIGQDFRDIIFKDNIKAFEKMFKDSLSGIYHDVEMQGTDTMGVKRWVQGKTSPVYRPNGELLGVSVLIEQIDDRKKAEIEIRESEEKFRSIVEQSLVGVYIIQDEQLVYANPGFQKIFGYTEERLVGKVAFEDIVHPDDVALVRKNYKSRIKQKSIPNQYTFRAFNSKGDLLHLEVIVSQIPYQNRPAVIGTLVDITDRIMEEMRINKAAIEAQESERYQIGMELHDNVQQILVGTGMFLEHALRRIDEPKKVAQIINNIRGYNAEAVTELRRLSHQLAPSVDVETSLEQKIYRLIESLNISEGAEIRVEIGELTVDPNDEVQLAFYRVLQEQMTNILKYAKASEVQIRVLQNAEKLTLSVEDNGVGFDTESKKGGIGLENIKRRAHALNGTMKIESSPGQGCTLFFEVPVT